MSKPKFEVGDRVELRMFGRVLEIRAGNRYLYGCRFTRGAYVTKGDFAASELRLMRKGKGAK